MWVYLEPWIVQDGALPELARGSHLRGVGLWADCRSVGPARTAMDGIAELAGPDSAHESGGCRYELTGVAGPARGIRTGNEEHAGSEFVITAGDLGMVARTTGPVSGVAAGSRVTAQCTLNVAADYEWDAFELPDLRADWYVSRLKIEQRQIDYVRGAPGGPVAGWPGKVLRSFEIERMSRRDDDHAGTIMARYVLDLTPLPASQDPAGAAADDQLALRRHFVIVGVRGVVGSGRPWRWPRPGQGRARRQSANTASAPSAISQATRPPSQPSTAEAITRIASRMTARTGD